MVPKATPVAVLINSNFSDAENQLHDVQEAAARLGVQLVVARANAEPSAGRSAPGLLIPIL
jgi:formyltetrahydrofolate synthetase